MSSVPKRKHEKINLQEQHYFIKSQLDWFKLEGTNVATLGNKIS